jgi:hypothetical protein
MDTKMREPTWDQCTANDKVYDGDGVVGYAIWYPQMGGYVGKAIAVMDKEWVEYKGGSRKGGCIDVFVWHNGEFPFGEEDDNPREIHLCDPEQFIVFGEKLSELNSRGCRKDNSLW